MAALPRVAQRLEPIETIDAAAPKRDQGPGAGHYIVLAALNRALAPCSKLAIGDWYEQTVLRRLWGFDQTAFSSQRFWDPMSLVSDAAIEAIQEALVPRIRREFGLDAEVLLYDTTNFFLRFFPRPMTAARWPSADTRRPNDTTCGNRSSPPH